MKHVCMQYVYMGAEMNLKRWGVGSGGRRGGKKREICGGNAYPVMLFA